MLRWRRTIATAKAIAAITTRRDSAIRNHTKNNGTIAKGANDVTVAGADRERRHPQTQTRNVNCKSGDQVRSPPDSRW